MMMGLVLGDHVVPVDSLFTIFPNVEEVHPNHSQGPYGQVGAGVHSSPDFSLPNKVDLPNMPFYSQVTIEQVTPTGCQLLADELVILTGVALNVDTCIGK
jgi:hypothetical protein